MNLLVKDAEGCGKWVKQCLEKRPKKGFVNMPIDVIVWMARWAGHWGNLALRSKAE